MEIGYRCVNCRHVYQDIIGKCDCNNDKFVFKRVAIIDVPDEEEEIPQLNELHHSRGPRLVNYRNGSSWNGVYEYQGLHENGRPRVGILGNMGSSYDHVETTIDFNNRNMQANCVLTAASPELLEVAYMCYNYFNTKRKVQGNSPKTEMRIKLIAQAIHAATDLSVYKEPQDAPVSK
ncbi:hypothetical protein pEaSNUABM34_00042 [Erwinia phage pEa_SNUABM_34]|nr:hypothetical protein pEaSNUABM34_00042 [Erwinia phage pEa_SNUABM_34]